MRLSVTFIWRSVPRAAFVDSLAAGETGAVHGSGAERHLESTAPDAWSVAGLRSRLAEVGVRGRRARHRTVAVRGRLRRSRRFPSTMGESTREARSALWLQVYVYE